MYIYIYMRSAPSRAYLFLNTRLYIYIIYIYIHMNKAYLLVWINESVQSIYLQKQANTSSLSICKANVLVWTNTSSHLQTKHVWAHFPSLCIRSIHQNAPSKKNETNSKQQKNKTKNRKNRKNLV